MNGAGRDTHGPLDQLRASRAITLREYEGGLYLAALIHRAMWHRGRRDAGYGAALDLLRHQLDEIEIDLWPLLRAVCIERRTPKTAVGLRRLREALQALALRVDKVEAAIAGCKGVA